MIVKKDVMVIMAFKPQATKIIRRKNPLNIFCILQKNKNEILNKKIIIIFFKLEICPNYIIISIFKK